MVTITRKLFIQDFLERSMQIKLLKDVVASIIGPNTSTIVDLLYGKKNVNEFLIAKKLNLTINQTRNILYKLADEGLVSFIRKKDSKKGGWYTYFWTLDTEKSLLNLKNALLKEMDNLKNQLNSKRAKRFYYCPNCHVEYTEENALIHNFVCPECGAVFEFKDNTLVIKQIEKDVLKVEENLNVVNKELDDISKKAEISVVRKLKVEAKKKIADRLVRKKEREKLAKKEKAKINKIKGGKKERKVKNSKVKKKTSKKLKRRK